jgi:hypothetical protein
MLAGTKEKGKCLQGRAGLGDPQTILCDCSVAVRKICTKEKGKCLQGRAGLIIVVC